MSRQPQTGDLPPSVPGEASRRAAGRRRLLAAASSIACHLLILASMLAAWPRKPLVVEESPLMTVSLVDAKSLVPTQSLQPPSGPAPVSPPPRNIARVARSPRDDDPLPAEKEPAEEPAPQVTETQLAGAMTADSGAPGAGDSGPTGRTCNMARSLQNALRKDPLVLAAVAASGGKAMMVWNGDWVRSSGEDGKGLAAVREAIMWEVAFSPEACRTEPVHGLVLISLRDGPGSARLVVGSGEWRWSDLLTPRVAADR